MTLNQDGSHEGRPLIRWHSNPTWLLVLCPAGHVHTAVTPDQMKSFAGSFMQMKVSDPNWTVKCHGGLSD